MAGNETQVDVGRLATARHLEPAAACSGVSGNLAGLTLSIICLALCGLFVFSGSAKMMQPYDFLSSLYSYRIFSRPAGVLVAAIVPPLEVVVGVALLSRRLQRAALLVSTFLCVCFLLVRAFAVQSGLDVECNCLGSGVIIAASSLDWSSVVHSLLLLCVSGFGFFLSYAGREKEAALAVRSA